MTDTDLEHRVRRALTARAGQITPERLRFAAPPTVATRPRTRRWWWLAVPVAAVLAVAFTFAGLIGPADDAPVLPGTTPTVVPSPTLSESAQVTPEPAKPPADPTTTTIPPSPAAPASTSASGPSADAVPEIETTPAP